MIQVFNCTNTSDYHMMRNARFGPLTLLMTLRVIDVKSEDKFTRLFYVSVHDANIRFLAETVFIGSNISFGLSYKLSTMNQRLPRNP